MLDVDTVSTVSSLQTDNETTDKGLFKRHLCPVCPKGANLDKNIKHNGGAPASPCCPARKTVTISKIVRKTRTVTKAAPVSTMEEHTSTVLRRGTASDALLCVGHLHLPQITTLVVITPPKVDSSTGSVTVSGKASPNALIKMYAQPVIKKQNVQAVAGEVVGQTTATAKGLFNLISGAINMTGNVNLYLTQTPVGGSELLQEFVGAIHIAPQTTTIAVASQTKTMTKSTTAAPSATVIKTTTKQITTTLDGTKAATTTAGPTLTTQAPKGTTGLQTTNVQTTAMTTSIAEIAASSTETTETVTSTFETQSTSTETETASSLLTEQDDAVDF